MISVPTETVTVWHPVAPAERDAYGNLRPATYDAEHSEDVGGVVVGELSWDVGDADEARPDAVTETVTLYMPKGSDGPYDGCMVTVRLRDYLVTECHAYTEAAVPGPHNTWLRAVRRVGQ